MLQTLLERAPTRDQMNDTWLPGQEKMTAYTAKNILIVEDDPGIRDILGEILQEETIHQVFLAPDGETALNMLQTTTPDLLLVDYKLPGMNGLELLNHIRRINGYEHTPIMLMSASLLREDITEHHFRYIRKPFDLDKLLAMVEDTFTAQDLETRAHK